MGANHTLNELLSKASPNVILRLSQKLATKVKVGPLKPKPLADNPYADWSGHLFTAERTQYVIISNTKSLYSCVMYGKGITRDDILIDHAMTAMREFMIEDGQGFAFRRFIVPSIESFGFAKALDRSVTASMNHLISYAKTLLTEAELSPFEVGFKLNDFLTSAIASEEHPHYSTPKQAFKLLTAPQNAPQNKNN